MRTEILAVGREISATHKVVYQRALARMNFSDDSSHNDDNAKDHGYPGALVSAYVLAGLMSEPMVGLFGASWFSTGRIALTFVGKGVQQGDHVTCRGVVRNIERMVDGAQHVTLDVWMEKEDGTKAIVGEASGVVAAITN